MSSKTDHLEGTVEVNASLKTQDKPIINAFAHAEHKVLTTTEVAKEVDLSERQVRRRLKDLASRNILGTRKPSQSRLWWVKEDIKEPITAQYPLLRFARDRMSVQLFLIGLTIGIAAVLLVVTATFTYAYNVAPPFVTKATFLQAGFLASMLASGFLISAIAVATISRMLRYFDINLIGYT
jgi:hypothetical protein